MNKKWIGFSAILVGMSASAIMQTLVATAMPVIAGELGGLHLYSWGFGGYMLASTVTIPLFARLADMFGRRTLYLAGLGIFLTGSALIGTAQNMETLVGFRIMQGIGSGAVGPAALASIGDLFGDHERGKIFGIFGAVQILANLIGPPLGGWITDTISWRWGFFMVIPIGALAAYLAARGLQPGQRLKHKEFHLEWVGALLIGMGLCSSLVGIQNLGSDQIQISLLLCASALVLLGAAAYWEQKQHDPIIPVPLLKIPTMWRPILGTMLLGMATNSAIAYFPLYLQKMFSQSATETGISLLPMLLMVGLASGVGGSFANTQPGPVQILAWLLSSLGFGLLAFFHGENILIMTGLIGAGLGLLLPIYLHTAQHASGEAHLATASGMIQMARNMGGALGIPLLGSFLVLGETSMTAYVFIFASLACLGILGVLLGINPNHNHHIHN